MGEFVLDQAKLAEMVVFFTRESETDLLFGSTKLNKLLFLADFLAYGYLGRPITGAEYIHQEHGPTPQPKQLLPVFRMLQDAGRLRFNLEETYRGPRRRPVALSEPNTALFSEDELDICRDALSMLRYMSGIESSKWSHQIPGWRFTRHNEVIPYHTAYLMDKTPPTKEDIDWAIRMANELNLVPG